ncbi:MAG TPA: signal peptidase I [Bacillota bacterium]|nr:signal peptidase I [Bacillota bacterium]
MDSKRKLRNIYIIIGILLMSLILYNFFWFLPVISLKTYIVDGVSMEPTFQIGERFIVSGLYYRNHKISRGDVILFTFPKNPGSIYFKRIVALGGEKIEIKDSKIFINGSELDKAGSFTFDGNSVSLKQDLSISVPQNAVFVLGDNLDNSLDSRTPLMGPIDIKYIKGKVLFVYFSKDAKRIGHKI